MCQAPTLHRVQVHAAHSIQAGFAGSWLLTHCIASSNISAFPRFSASATSWAMRFVWLIRTVCREKQKVTEPVP